MNQKAIQTLFLILLIAAGAIIAAVRGKHPQQSGPLTAPSRDRDTSSVPNPPVRPAQPDPTPAVRSDIGFRSRTQFLDHFEKHGREFRATSADEYLRLAQTLRDAPRGGNVLEVVRATDGVVTRFDKRTGAFLAFNSDRTIRTFFRPNDGEAYFRRQVDRPEDGQ